MSRPLPTIRPREHIQRLEADLATARLRITYLEGLLAETGLDGAALVPPELGGISKSQLAIVIALARAHPRTLDGYDLDEAMPRRDHAADRNLKTVAVQISNIRRRLGKDSIRNVRGQGFTLSDELAERLKPVIRAP